MAGAALTMSVCATNADGTAISSQRMGSVSDLDEGVFDPVEHAAIVVGLLGRARGRVELLIEHLLILGERARDHDVEVHELIAAAGGTEVWHALPFQTHGLAVLRSGELTLAGANIRCP